MAEHREYTDAAGKGIEQEPSYGRKKPAPKAAPAKPQTEGKLPKWKIQSMQFQAAMKANSGSGSGGGASNFNPSFEASQPPDDRIDCQWCGRKFNEQAGNRHIPVCE